MCPDKTYKDKLHCKLYNNYKPVIIAPDVEYIALAADCVYAIEHFFNIGKRPPFGRPYLFSPIL